MWLTAAMEDVVEDASELTLLDMLPPVVAAPVPCDESLTDMIIGMLERVLLLDIVLMTSAVIVVVDGGGGGSGWWM